MRVEGNIFGEAKRRMVKQYAADPFFTGAMNFLGKTGVYGPLRREV